MKTYDIILDTGDMFTVIAESDLDEFHGVLYNEEGLIRFTLWDGKPALLKGSAIIAMWGQ